MLYLDSNVFIYAALSREAIGTRARQLLQKVRDGQEEAGSCSLTFDEVVWVVQRHRSRGDAIAAGQSFLALANLRILGVDQDSLFAALSLMNRYPLHPRDAIHASTAIASGCSAIVSSDNHFDRVNEITRKPI
jgi:predicted nucleic acid-binding protein